MSSRKVPARRVVAPGVEQVGAIGSTSGGDVICGGAGADTIDARDGTRDSVDCGGGSRDRAIVDRKDRVEDCETVKKP